MAASILNPDTTAQLELRALERLIGALCEHTELLCRDARAYRGSKSREIELQLQVFDERRSQALEALETDRGEPCETRIARLQKLAEALDCSRAYFRPDTPETETPEWAIRLP